MNRNFVRFCAIATLIITASCKKEETKIIGNGREITVNSTERIPPADGKYPTIDFSETEHDFGTINQGDKVNCVFNFKNTGEADLLISSAVGSCGCTVPDYPKQAIKPGETGEIKVSFNSAGKKGMQQKTVTLKTNTEKGTEILKIKANINLAVGSNMQPVASPKK